MSQATVIDRLPTGSPGLLRGNANLLRALEVLEPARDTPARSVGVGLVGHPRDESARVIEVAHAKERREFPVGGDLVVLLEILALSHPRKVVVYAVGSSGSCCSLRELTRKIARRCGPVHQHGRTAPHVHVTGQAHPSVPLAFTAVALQRQAGRSRFLISATVETAEDLSALRTATGAELLLVVCLSASPETVIGRLRAREPDDWPGKAPLIERARHLAPSTPRLPGINLVISTEERMAKEVAAEIFEVMRSRGLLEMD